MICAVTGGSGLVGSYTIDELLSCGYEVRNLDRTPPKEQQCPFFTVDITDLGKVANALSGCDAVIHLAAIPSPFDYPSQTVYVNNTVGNYNVLEAAVMLGIKRVCMASSVNAIGLGFSLYPEFDYFPIDENHRSRAEDCYSLSKWCGEQQADGFAKRYPEMTLVSCRYHSVTRPEAYAAWSQTARSEQESRVSQLWAYTDARDAARANRLAIEATWTGHHAFFITAEQTRADASSRDLAAKYYPDVEIRGDFGGHASFFDCSKAERLLEWKHELDWRTISS
jgi:UDP-glucose 4-epimerase